jgi:predicted 3-demethylubiquinone-9 3-methyltransferase (glyoxalase superfamily)
MPRIKQKISVCLWFDGRAEEAARFYAGIFGNSSVGGVAHYDDETSKSSGQPKGSVMTVKFTLDGQEFLGLNGGPLFKFTEAMSLIVACDDQAELDHFWSRLSSGGGEEVQCGWLKDKFGVSWQVVPAELDVWLSGKDPAATSRVMAAVMQMKKLDIATMKKAYEGRG